MQGNPAERRAVVLSALPVEYQAVREQLSDLREADHERGTIYEIGTFPAGGEPWRVLIVEIGAGNEGAASEAERAIAYFDPRVALFVGVAGGLKDVAVGDVVAATDVFGYEAGKARRHFEPRPNVGKATYRLVQRARAEARKPGWRSRIRGERPGTEPRVIVAPIAAGAKVVADTRAAVSKFLRRTYGHAAAVEMEGRGFLRAAEANQQVDALVVRGISDMIDDKSRADAAGFQLLAARHAAAFAFSVLAGYEAVSDRATEGLSPEAVRRFIERFCAAYRPYESKHAVLTDPREVYVPVKCKPQHPQDAPATDAVDWLRDGIAAGQVQMVFSHYGLGKSFLALELQRRLAEEFFEQPGARPIPVVFPLRLYRSRAVLDDLYPFLEKHGFPVRDRDELSALLRAGRLVVILDAIDEIPLVQTVEPERMTELLASLDLRRFGPCPWVATSRTGFFSATLPMFRDHRDVRVAYLQEWDAAQWLRYVHLCDKDFRIFRSKEERTSFLVAVDRAPRLRGFTATPLFARMLVESWPAIRTRPADLNRVDLYRHYTDFVLAARQEESPLPDLESRRQCLESAAVHFFRSSVLSCSSKELLSIADAYVRDIGRQELAAFVRIELQNYSLLVCDQATGEVADPAADDRLGFSHKSFYEYFLALAILRELCVERFGPSAGALLQRRLDVGEAAFLGELLAREEHRMLRYELGELLRQDNALYAPAFRRNLVVLAVGLARAIHRETAAVEMLEQGSQPRGFAEAPDGSIRDPPLAGAILVNHEISGLDFSGLNLNGSDLRGVIADGASFARAEMRACNLAGAKLTDCDFSGSDLRGATLSYCVLTRVLGTGPPPRLAGASLEGITVRRHDATYLGYAVESDKDGDEAWRSRALQAIRKGMIDAVAEEPSPDRLSPG